jgi:hypothetical protein
MRWATRFAGRDGALAFVAYLALAMFWYRGVIVHMESACACGVAVDSGDNSNFVWTFEWFVHAIANGLPLLHPTAIWSPTGINLAGTTTRLLLDALASSLTVLWGPLPPTQGNQAKTRCTGHRAPGILHHFHDPRMAARGPGYFGPFRDQPGDVGETCFASRDAHFHAVRRGLAMRVC